jgi:hypothetical protein
MSGFVHTESLLNRRSGDQRDKLNQHYNLTLVSPGYGLLDSTSLARARRGSCVHTASQLIRHS